MRKQDEVFWESEGDRWFARNKDALVREYTSSTDPILRLMSVLELVPRRVLEVGASNGARLDAVRRTYRADCIAVEPSMQALGDGQARFPHVQFVRGLAQDLSLIEEGPFDLVIVSFVFHWISRGELLKSCSEVDRVVEEGGHLIISDFLPAFPTRVSYHHRRGLWTFKQDYTRVFLNSGLYSVAGWATFNVSTMNSRRLRFDANVEPSNRGMVACLKKNLTAGYVTSWYKRKAAKR